jgi:hypothetical protein
MTLVRSGDCDTMDGATVVLVTTASPLSNGIGSLFLRDLMAARADIQTSVIEEPPFLLGTDGAVPSKLKRLMRATSTRIPLFHALRLKWFRRFLLQSRAREVSKKVQHLKADRLWVTASSVEMIWIAQMLATQGLSIRVTVWDAPEYLCANLGLPTSLREDVLNSFADLLLQAQAVSVVGQAMQADYHTRFGAKSEIIRHGISVDRRPQNRQRGPHDPLRIVFAGSLYSKQEWNSFVEALESSSWTVGGRPISLHFIGRFPLSGARKADHITFHGEKSFEQSLQIMSDMDIGYLPYWFDPACEIAARTSFPGKLSAYAAAGLAVFHHAPVYTEAASFLRAFPFGVTCPSLDRARIIDVLLQLSAAVGSAEILDARERAYCEELSQDAMAKRFGKFLGYSDK